MSAPPDLSAPSRPAPASRALVIWLCAMSAYVCAVAARTSLGVAGVEAMDRFSMSAGSLSFFSTLQIGVYALAQIPVGVALDRFGPRRLLSTGAVLVSLGQIAMAVAPSLPAALAARVLLGIGDATAFVSVLRLLPSWFSPFRIPLFTQLTSILGLLGQVISAVPFMAVLHHRGWTTAFATMAGLGFAAALLVVAVVRDAPTEASAGGPPAGRTRPNAPAEPIRATLRAVLSSPWAWLGFFTHWSGAGPAMTFTLLWGMPFMTLGLGMPAPQASTVLVLNTAASIVCGPVVGQLTARHPRGRVPGVLAVSAVVAGAWAAILGASSPAPAWAAALLSIVLAASGCASSIGFDFVRQGVGPHRLGTATGTTNMGGFTAALLNVQLIGWVLDRVSAGTDYTWADFRVALCVQAAAWAVGAAGVAASAALIRRRAGRVV